MFLTSCSCSCKEPIGNNKKNLSIIPSIEGLASSEWVVLDIDTIVVHVFLPDLRGLYNLEELWSCTPSPSVQ